MNVGVCGRQCQMAFAEVRRRMIVVWCCRRVQMNQPAQRNRLSAMQDVQQQGNKAGNTRSDCHKVPWTEISLEPKWLRIEEHHSLLLLVFSFPWASCTRYQPQRPADLLEQMYDFQKRTTFLQKWILNLQDLPQNQSPETVPICIA